MGEERGMGVPAQRTGFDVDDLQRDPYALKEGEGDCLPWRTKTEDGGWRIDARD